MAAGGTGVRGRILDAISSIPGIHMRELARVVGISLSGISHHVRVLERQGLVVGVSDRHYRRFFSSRLVLPKEARRLDEVDRRLLAECRRATSLAIILSLAVEGPMTHREVTRRLKRSRGTVTHHLTRLSVAGIVTLGAGSNGATYELVDPSRVVSLLATFSNTLQDRLDGFARLWSRLRD